MENTKDIIYSVQYFNRIGETKRIKGRRYKRTSIKEKIQNKIKENKSITVIITTMITLMIADFALINSFMNLMSQWGEF